MPPVQHVSDYAATVTPPGLTLMPVVPPPEATATATAASATVAGTVAAAPATATPVTAQVAPALLSLGPAGDGSPQMTLRLQPAELGTVQIHIGRTATGAAHVEITAEKADTLQALLHDQPQLHRALDEAGVPAAGRTITFQAAAPLAADGNGSAFAGSGQGDAAGGGLAAGTGSHGGRSGQAGGETGNDAGSRRQARASTAHDDADGVKSWRIGLDILA